MKTIEEVIRYAKEYDGFTEYKVMFTLLTAIYDGLNKKQENGEAISRKSIMHKVFELYCKSELHSPRAYALEEVIELIKKEKPIELHNEECVENE